MKIKFPWSQPEIDNKELDQIIDSFKADWLTMGPKVKEFEQKLADYLKVHYAIAVTNGTIALDLALKVLGVVPGDEVIVPAMTYFSTASAVSYQFATPVFVDIEPQSYNLDHERIEESITEKTKGIIFIDYGGNPADINKLKRVAQKHNLFILQDAAQSLGGVFQGEPLGAQTAISSMSFHMAKIMTSVEGGMVFTNDENIAKELRIRRNQGESGKYLHSHLGTNARMTDISAAIGLAQFEKLTMLLEKRQRVADKYGFHFQNHSNIEIMQCLRPNSKKANFFYPILVRNRKNVVEHLSSKGIDIRIAYPMPVYAQELYRSGRAACQKTECPVAERFTSQVINLPIYPSLTNKQVDEIANEIIKVCE